MKILFFISVLGHGRGGHFHSLHHISNEIAKRHDVNIVSIGPGDNSTISRNSNYLTHIYFSGINLLSLKLKVNSVIKKHNPDIIHFFDINSYNVISPLVIKFKLNTVVSKCGGPNPGNAKYYPFISNLIVFSLENKLWFENNTRYRKSNIALIPNRVAPINSIPLDIIKPEKAFSFIKIARIGQTYKNSILDAINLIDTLLQKNNKHELKLFIVGVVEDPRVLEEILSNELVKNGTVTVLTQEKYTKQASKMLYLADAAIATGRGVMEAASMQIPVLTISSQSRIPVLLSENTFNEAFETNFSDRSSFSHINDYQSLADIERLISDDSYYEEISLFMKSVFDSYFNIENALGEYERFYKAISQVSPRGFYLSPIATIKSLYGFYKNSVKN